MICEGCKKDEKKSRIYETYEYKELHDVGDYYDEEGYFHQHRAPIINYIFKCSNGHIWKKESGIVCKWLCGLYGICDVEGRCKWPDNTEILK